MNGLLFISLPLASTGFFAASQLFSGAFRDGTKLTGVTSLGLGVQAGSWPESPGAWRWSLFLAGTIYILGMWLAPVDWGTVLGAPDDVPGQPNRPAVQGGFEQISVTWSTPSNSGPPITSYDIKYEIENSGNPSYEFLEGVQTSATFTGLDRGKRYQAQVRARNENGRGPWSDPGKGRVQPNNSPGFEQSSYTLTTPEGASEGNNIGSPYTATDSDEDELSYSISGDDSSTFSIESNSGQISLAQGASLDFENPMDQNRDNSYLIQVTATDPFMATANMDLTIEVTNEDEIGPVTLSHTSPRVDMTLTASISDKENQVSSETWQWQRADNAIDPAWMDIAGANAASYLIVLDDIGKLLRALAHYRNQQGQENSIHSEATAAVGPLNRAPVFSSSSVTRSVQENTPLETPVGEPVTANDADNDPLTYSLSGADAPTFDLQSSTGQIITKKPLDYESQHSYQVTVTAVDGYGGSASIQVTITIVNDSSEVPGQPNRPSAAGGFERINLSWDPPATPGPAITGYEVRYKIKGSNSTTTITLSGSQVEAVLSGLLRGKEYHVEVRAINSDGPGPWSPKAEARTLPNRPPAFDTDALPSSISVPEGTSPGSNIGSPYTATDEDEDELIYSLSGDDSSIFSIERNSGQLSLALNAYLDFETPLDQDQDNAYQVSVVAEDPFSTVANFDVTISVSNVEEVGPASISHTSPRVGITLTASLLDTENEVLSNTWQWQRGDDSEEPAWMDIIGATSQDYVVSASDQGSLLRAAATYRNQQGQENSVHSEATAAVGPPNRAPAFPSPSVARSVQENLPDDTSVGKPVTATDLDADPLTYSLSGADASSFDLHSSSGQIIAKESLDYESQHSYQVTVTADDGYGGSASIEVAIAVLNDSNEVPGQPGRPSVSGGFEQITVTWSAPASSGPAVAEYRVRYRVKLSSDAENSHYQSASFNETAGVITSLERDTTYQVAVQAINSDGSGPWSPTTEGATWPNRIPGFEAGNMALSVGENTPADTSIGDPFQATDDDGDRLAYSIAGIDASSFDIGSVTGQLKTKTALDYETKDSYSFAVLVTDGWGGSDQVTVTIAVLNVLELPGEPDNLTVNGGLEQITVSWSAPTYIGSTITGYMVRHRVKPSSEEQVATYESKPYHAPPAVITGLERGTTYQVGIQAFNAEGQGPWSTEEGNTLPNRLPAFPATESARSVPEDSEAMEPIGAPFQAKDGDGDTLTYTLAGTDASLFDIDSFSGQLRTKSLLDYETRESYALTILVDDGHEGIGSIEVTITIVNVREPPGQLAVPTLTGQFEQITVSWTEPDYPDPPITGYRIRYRAISAPSGNGPLTFDKYASFDEPPAVLSGLPRGTTHEVEVRAVNSDGEGPWSESVQGKTWDNSAPSFIGNPPERFAVAGGKSSCVSIGEPYYTEDNDGDEVLYSLGGEDAGAFVVNGLGQIMVAPGFTLDFLNPVDWNKDNEYVLEVLASDSFGGSDRKNVRIAVTGHGEAESVELSSLYPKVGSILTAALRTGDSGAAIDMWQWERAEDTAKCRWSNISGANSNTYSIVPRDLNKQLMAAVSYTDSSGKAKLLNSPATEPVRPANRSPRFAGANTMRYVEENLEAGTPIGPPVQAIDADGDTLAYFLYGPDAATFIIDAASGQLRTKKRLNYEVLNRYQVSITADDGFDGTASIEVTIIVLDTLGEAPGRIDAPYVEGGFEQIKISWDIPDNLGPPITGYEIKYGVRGSDSHATITVEAPQTTTTISGLRRGKYYRVEVRAINGEGQGPWSSPSEGRISPNQAPRFERSSLPSTITVPEGPSGGESLGRPYVAKDDDNDPLFYKLSGEDSKVLSVEATVGQLEVSSGYILDYENPVDQNEDNIYNIEVIVADGLAASDRMDVTLIVTDVTVSDPAHAPHQRPPQTIIPDPPNPLPTGVPVVPTLVPLPTLSPTYTPVLSPTPTRRPSTGNPFIPTPTVTAIPTMRPTASVTPTLLPTSTLTPTPTVTPTASPTPTLRPTVTPTPVPTPTLVATPTPLPTATPIPTQAPTLTPARTPEPLPTPTLDGAAATHVSLIRSNDPESVAPEAETLLPDQQDASHYPESNPSILGNPTTTPSPAFPSVSPEPVETELQAHVAALELRPPQPLLPTVEPTPAPVRSRRATAVVALSTVSGAAASLLVCALLAFGALRLKQRLTIGS